MHSDSESPATAAFQKEKSPMISNKITNSMDFPDFQKSFLEGKGSAESPSENETSNGNECLKEIALPEKTRNSKKALSKKVSNLEINFKSSATLVKNLNVKRFLKKIKDSAHFPNHNIMEESRCLLNDVAIPLVQETKETSNQGIKKIRASIFKKFAFLSDFILKNLWIGLSFKVFKTFHPFKKAKISWDILVFLNTLVLFFYIPFTMSFDLIGEDRLCNLINLSQFGIYLFDMIITLNTAYIDNGVVVHERWKVCTHYFKGNFILDLIAIFSLVLQNEDLLLLSSPLKKRGILLNVQLFFFARVSSFRERFKKIKEFFCLDSKMKGILDLCVLLGTSILVSHVIACLFHMLAADSSFKHTWLINYSINQKHPLEQYLYSLYWSTITLMTVGYGDIVPQNSQEIAFTLVTVYCGCIIFGYNLNKIASIFQDMNKQSEEIQTKINKLNKFMESKGINANLQMRVRAYLKFYWRNEIEQLNQELVDMIGSLSEPLKAELYLHSYGEILKSHPIFSKNFSEEFLSELSCNIEEQTCMKREIIFLEKDHKNTFLFFIVSGEVELFHSFSKEKPPIILKRLGEKSFFGDLSFFTGRTHINSARASDYSKLYKISRTKFLEVLARFPNDYERYCELKDKIILYQSYDHLNLRCLICHHKGHLCDKCPHVHYIANREAILLRHVFSQKQERVVYMRTRKKCNTFLQKKVLGDAASKIRKLITFESEENLSESNFPEPDLNNFCEPDDQKSSSLEKNEIERPRRAVPRKTGNLNSLSEHEIRQLSRLLSSEEGKNSQGQPKSPKSEKMDPSPPKMMEVEIELVKSFENYFPKGNIDRFLERYAHFRKEIIKENKIRKKMGMKPGKGSRKSGYSFQFEDKRNMNSESPTDRGLLLKESLQSKSLKNSGFCFLKEVEKPLNFLNLVQKIKIEKGKNL